MARAAWILPFLVLTACGESLREERGSLGWDAGTAVIEVSGSTYVLELNNNGSTTVRIERSDGQPVAAFAPGDSLRERRSGPRTWHFTIPDGGAAHVDYVVQGEADCRVETRID